MTRPAPSKKALQIFCAQSIFNDLFSVATRAQQYQIDAIFSLSARTVTDCMIKKYKMTVG